jgi:hypothetical protein
MTTLQKTNASLPEETAENLREIRESSPVHFQAAVIALRNNNWPLRTIGDVFGVTRVAVKSWHNRALLNPEAIKLADDFPAPSLPLSARGRDARPKRLKPGVPPDDQKKFAELAQAASVVRRWTPQDSPAREAATDLEALVYEYVVEKNVSPSLIAQYAGVSRRAIVQRLEKARKAVA